MKNNIKLDAVKTKINISDYTLQDIAKYFLKYDGYTCEIETKNYLISFKFSKYSLPHLLGLHYVYDKKLAKYYKGKFGFEKLLNNEIIVKEIKSKLQDKSKWLNIKRRLEYLPMFINVNVNMELDKNVNVGIGQFCTNSFFIR